MTRPSSGNRPSRSRSSIAFRSSVATMYAIEWSADCRVRGSIFAGLPMIPNAGSYARISIERIDPPSASATSPGAFRIRSITACSAPADWCSYSPSLKCIPITAKSSPEWLSTRSNGLGALSFHRSAPALVGSKKRKIASGFLKISRGPTNPRIDRSADAEVSTGLPFFDHMLDQIGKHGGVALKVRTEGDLHIDEHHTIEDTGIALGQALRQALGDKRGIARYGFTLPMDETLASAALDLGGRPYLVFHGEFRRERVGDMPTELVEHFFRSLCDAAALNLNLKVEGENDHHKVEACFKAFARALRMAVRREGAELPSTKGLL